MNLVDPSAPPGSDAMSERTASRSHVCCLQQGGLGCSAMPTCCAVGCYSSIAKGDKLFVVPRGKNNEERRAVWLHRIGRKKLRLSPREALRAATTLRRAQLRRDTFSNRPTKLRGFKNGNTRSQGATGSSRALVLCATFTFQEADLVKNFVHNIRGDVVVIPRDKWSLKDDAVPRLFPNCPKYLSKPLRKRKAPAVRSPLQPKRRNVQDDGEQENTAPNTFVYGERDGSVSGSVTLDSTQSLFEELSTMAQKGRRLQGWSTELVDSVVVQGRPPRRESPPA
ncbi:hypothetical protein HPB51_009533 [Rhipicephalus microplus]|uniref:THAP-type domain-containing protein n=1 Tax=Rhipicephalus microplus TaxID=6941 RepID=A0A9J6F0L2_RHIMP|nr:hypothetical protein HPB51_009533 [Rhipicephalus microplus]